jgi:hypothetical protein
VRVGDELAGLGLREPFFDGGPRFVIELDYHWYRAPNLPAAPNTPELPRTSPST